MPGMYSRGKALIMSVAASIQVFILHASTCSSHWHKLHNQEVLAKLIDKIKCMHNYDALI